MESAIEEFVKKNPKPVLFMASVILSDENGSIVERFIQKAEEFNIKHVAVDFVAEIDEACNTDVLKNYLIKTAERHGQFHLANILKNDNK